VRCETDSVGDLVDSRLHPLRLAINGSADVSVDIRGPGHNASWPAAPTGPGRSIYDAPGTPIEYFDDSDQLFVDYEHRVRMLCTPGRGLIEMSVTGSDDGDPILATHPLLTVALLETLKRSERYPLHAACVSLNGRGVLVPGASGSGKSTLSVTLVRAGFDFLSDDTVFLASSDEGVWVWGFPDEIDVMENTVAMIPELGHLAGLPLRAGRDKHGFRVEEVFGVSPLAGCRPAALIAPKVVQGTRSELVPLSRSEALLELMPNILLTEPVSTQAHLDMLGTLVETVPCLTFQVGSDLDAAAACVAELLA
jgi:hypothetical protein